jgi:hypothetical protein
MAIKRIVDTGFWTDDKVVDEFSPEDRYFMLYLMTNPHSSQLGIYKFNKRIMAFEMGYSVEAVSVMLERFQDKYKVIIISEETNEIAILNYLRYSIMKGGKPVEDLLVREIGEIKNKDLIGKVFEHIRSYENLNITVLKVIEQNLSISNINDNDNENENGESYTDTPHESCNESYDDTSSDPVKKMDKIQDVVDLFNAVVPSMPKVKSLTATRKKNITLRLKDYGMEKIVEVFHKAEASDFLCGRIKEWKAGFDWVMKPENFVKIMEGNYDNKTSKQQEVTNNPFLKMAMEGVFDDE